MPDAPPNKPNPSDAQGPVKPVVPPAVPAKPVVPPVKPVVPPAMPIVPPAKPVVPPAMPAKPVVPPAVPAKPIVPPAVPAKPVVPPAMPAKPVVPPAVPAKPVVPPAAPAVPPAVPAKPVVLAAVPAKPVVPPAAPAKPVMPAAVHATPAAPPPPPPEPLPVAPPPPKSAPKVEAAPATPDATPVRPPVDPNETASASSAPSPTRPVAPTLVPKKRTPTGPPALLPADKDPYIGKTVGRCRIIERIGHGKTAVVYRAEHLALNLPVAVKILHPSILEFPEIVQKFDAEARAVARLDHANVLKVYDVLAEGDVHAIVMELLEGESVLDLVAREKSIDPVDALRIVRQGAAGLQAAHLKGIIHRDVKPQNLVVMPDGTVKLVDFGLATGTDDDEKSIRIGTPHYMAPEVCEARAVEPASDVYSLGITLYHLLVGQPPYAGQSIKEILRSHIEAKPLEPEKRRISLPKPIAELVRSMTKRDSLTRMTIAEVIATVDRIGGEELKKDLKLHVGRGRRRRGKQGAPIALIVIGALVVIGGLVALLAGGGKDKPGPTPARGAGTPPETPTLPTAGAGSTEPAVPVATAETEAERLKREAEYKKKEAEAKLRQAYNDLEEAASFARVHWEDKGAVVERYRLTYKRFADLEPGKEGKRRAELIAKGEMHPHPDKTYAEKNAVTRARETWEGVKGDVEKAIAEFRYDDAIRLVPSAVEDPEGTLADDVEFHRALTKDLVAFRVGLDGALDKMKPEAKDVTAKGAKGRVRRALAEWISIDRGGVIEQLPWTDVPPDELAALAKRAFEDKGPALNRALASFAWAHKRRNAFFQTAVALKTANAMSGASDPLLDKLFARAKARFGD